MSSGSEGKEFVEAEQIEMSTDVPANTTTDEPEVTDRKAPFDGKITSVVIGWPDGANNIVGVQIRRGNEDVIFPANREDDYVAANDFTSPFPLRKKIKQDEELQAVFVNLDGTNSHFVNVILNIEEDK